MAWSLIVGENRKVSVVMSPHWLTIFLGIAVAFSFVPFLIGYYIGLTVASEIVFGIYALISGLFADAVFRWKLKITLVLFQKMQIPFIAFWILVCGYIIVFDPW